MTRGSPRGLPPWVLRGAVALGVAAGAYVAAASLLWLYPSVLYPRLRIPKWWAVFWAGLIVLKQSARDLFAVPWALVPLLGLTAVFAVPLAVLVWRGGRWIRTLVATWTAPALGAALYAITLPEPRVVEVHFDPPQPYGPRADLRWFWLALGIQVALVSAFLLAWSVVAFRRRRIARACAALAGGAAAAVASWPLISHGVTWIEWV
ncbi:MAG: hypothetical protein HY775_10740 [Acidobacteria bacterium]|nr:hypothetical protein [Acidobacteriota bacterium]